MKELLYCFWYISELHSVDIESLDLESKLSHWGDTKRDMFIQLFFKATDPEYLLSKRVGSKTEPL